MATVSPLHSEDSRRLLDTIDQLRLLPSISHEIALPQIVVVGQQSSGKSSVLKALSNIDFPTNSGFCTQFATEIICRRETEASAKVSIIPSTAVDAQYRLRLDTFLQRWSNIKEGQDISEIIESAKHVMGLNSHQRITRDKLRLEFSGPRQDHISLIDMPGLFDQPLKGQRDDDKHLVDDMVREYIGAEQTIILAVVSGASDIQVQRIFGMFRPHCERTLGVITAPDMVDSGTARAATFQQLVANASFKAGHEWHVLRNLSYREEQDGEDRDEVERRFFAHRSLSPTDVWAEVPESRLGIHNFRTKLAKLLQSSITEGLPRIQRQLRNAQNKCNAELALLGEERSTPDQQRDYLADRSEKLRSKTTQELNGGNREQSLRSRIRNANDQFAENMLKFGAYWQFGPSKEELSSRNRSPSRDVSVEELPIPISDTEWLSIMLEEVSNSRGQELDGLVDPIWVGRMFLRQSRKWRAIAELHAEQTFAIVMQYFDEVIDEVVGPENATRFLENAIYPELKRRNKAFTDKVTELLTPYVRENIRTLNRNFRAQQKDLGSVLASGTDKKTLTQNMIAHYTSIMIEYYNLAMGVFVDNMESLAVENVLLGGLHEIMTATKSHRMSEGELSVLASESEEVTNIRRNLQARIQDYEEGSKIVSQFSIRGPQRIQLEKRLSDVNQKPTGWQQSAPRIVVEPYFSDAASTKASSLHQDANPSPSASSSQRKFTSGRRSQTPSDSGSSTRSSISRAFSDEADEADEADGVSSAASSVNSSPLKNRSSRRNKFEV